MKKILALLIICILFGGCSFTPGDVGGEVINVMHNATTEEVAKSISPAIVGISGMSRSSNSVGSGVCVGKNGYIVTNSHVVKDVDNLVIYLSDKSTTRATIVYEDSVLDFAIIKSNKAIPYLKLSKDSVQVGQDILAVGTPLSLNLTHTFTKGIVSAVDRTIKVNSSGGEGYMQNLIQHDASLNPGNSGGPLVNSKGEIVGINTLKISGGEGIGFAIPVKSFRSLLNNYIDDEDYETPYLGVYGLDSEIAQYQGITEENKGFYVIDVAENSPLRASGISKSGVITKLNGKNIENALDLKDELYKYKKGDKVSVIYVVDGRKEMVYVTI